jgi:hypothetical protein
MEFLVINKSTFMKIAIALILAFLTAILIASCSILFDTLVSGERYNFWPYFQFVLFIFTLSYIGILIFFLLNKYLVKSIISQPVMIILYLGIISFVYGGDFLGFFYQTKEHKTDVFWYRFEHAFAGGTIVGLFGVLYILALHRLIAKEYTPAEKIIFLKLLLSVFISVILSYQAIFILDFFSCLANKESFNFSNSNLVNGLELFLINLGILIFFIINKELAKGIFKLSWVIIVFLGYIIYKFHFNIFSFFDPFYRAKYIDFWSRFNFAFSEGIIFSLFGVIYILALHKLHKTS